MASIVELIREAQKNGTLKQERFTPAQWAYIKAVHSAADTQDATDLSKFAIACLPTGVYQFHGVRSMVRRVMGEKISHISIRADLRCKEPQCIECQRIITAFIRRLRTEVVLVLDAQNEHGTTITHDQLTVVMP
jgi:hypothetical protein